MVSLSALASKSVSSLVLVHDYYSSDKCRNCEEPSAPVLSARQGMCPPPSERKAIMQQKLRKFAFSLLSFSASFFSASALLPTAKTAPALSLPTPYKTPSWSDSGPWPAQTVLSVKLPLCFPGFWSPVHWAAASHHFRFCPRHPAESSR